jgi:nucleoside-diphosphate-sugar epimerase
LISSGQEVRVLDVWQDPELPKGVHFMKGDVRNADDVKKALKGVRLVHHNAALVPLTKSGKDFWSTNVEGTRIVASCSRKSTVEKMVHLSSSAVYGLPSKLPITETTPHRPVEIYGRSKSAAESVVLEEFSGEEERLVIIRPRTILGEGRLGIFQTLFEWIRQGLPIYTIGDGQIRFQFIHARDLLRAYMKVVEIGGYGSYNVGTENFGTLNEVFYKLIAYAETSSKVVHLPEKVTMLALRSLDFLRISPLAPWHYLTFHKDFYFDLTRIKSTGWTSDYSNDEMFRESYDSFLRLQNSRTQDVWESAHRKSVRLKSLKLLSKVFEKFS